MKNIILIILGFVSLILGIVGIFLPLLPTTPLVILASICFARSNEKLYNKLKKYKYFDDIIQNYVHNKGMKKSSKIFTLLFLWFSFIIYIFIIRNNVITLIFGMIAVIVTIHILTIKSR